MKTFRMIPITAAILVLAACADSPVSPTSVTANEAAASGSSNSPTTAPAGRVIIELVAPTGAPYAAAKGKAKFDTRGGRREFEIEVEHIPAGTAVEFYLGEVKLGSGAANAFGEANLELSTQLGQTVPTTVAGLVAQARLADGTVIATGSF